MTQRIGPHDRTTYVPYVRGSKIASRFYLKETGLSSRRARSPLRRFTWCYCGSFLSRVEKYIHVHVNSKRTDLSYSFMYSEDEVTVRDFYFVPCSQWISQWYPRVYVRVFVLKAGFPILQCRSVWTSCNSLRHGNNLTNFPLARFCFIYEQIETIAGKIFFFFFYSVKAIFYSVIPLLLSCKLFVS